MRLRRAFLWVLLVGVFLNLADWPYLDEIVEATPAGTLTELFGQQFSDAEKDHGGAHNVRLGYELLLAGVQAIPLEPLRLPEPQSDKAAVRAPLLVLSSIPQRIDRPPTLNRRS